MNDVVASIFTKQHLEALIYVLITVIVTLIIETVLRSLIRAPKKLDNRRFRTYIGMLRNTISIIVYIVALYIIFVLLGIDILPLVASVSIIGVVLGYGAGSIIKDFITGFFLISQESVVTGDYIKLDNAEGYVEAIKFRTTLLRSLGGELIIIPNSLIGTIVNYSYRRLNLLIDFSVKSDQDIDTVLKAMNDALLHLQKDPKLGEKILPGSAVNGIEEFKNLNNMITRATIVTNPTLRLTVARQYRYLVKKEFEKNKIAFS